MSEKIKRLFWLIVGHFFLVMGIVGPIPCIFLASACYRKGSARLHRMLRNNRLLKDALESWEDRRTISRSTKLIAICSLAASTISMFIFLSSPLMKIGIILIALLVACFIITRSTEK